MNQTQDVITLTVPETAEETINRVMCSIDNVSAVHISKPICVTVELRECTRETREVIYRLEQAIMEAHPDTEFDFHVTSEKAKEIP